MEAIKRILLVEDHPKDIELTLNALDEYNLANEVETACNAVEALSYLFCCGSLLDRPAGNPVVILLDIEKPEEEL